MTSLAAAKAILVNGMLSIKKKKFKHTFRQIENNNGPLSEQYGMVLSVSIAFASSTQGAQFPHQQQQSKSKSLLVS